MRGAWDQPDGGVGADGFLKIRTAPLVFPIAVAGGFGARLATGFAADLVGFWWILRRFLPR